MNRVRQDVSEMLREQVEYRELLYQMTLRDIRVRYKQAVMGFGWAIFMPLVNTVLFSVIFMRVAPLDVGVPYPVFAFTGLLFWNFFASSLRFAVNSLAGNATLVTKIYFPREIFPLSAILVCLVDLAVGSVMLVGLLIYYQIPVGPALVMIPVLLVIQTIFTAGIAFIVSMANLFLRDVKYVFDMLLTVWMFATSVVYPVELVGGTAGTLLKLNPMTPILDGYRAAILHNQWPDPGPLAAATALALVTLGVGWLVFHRAEYKFAEYASVSQAAVVVDRVWKKFNRAQRFNSLRDLVPALVGGLARRRALVDAELHGKEFWALRDVSFEVRPGEALGIIGPNGAGKSTMLKVLTRILRADRGTAAVHGRVGALVEIAAGFHPDLTGRENVFMQGAIMGMRRAEIVRKFDEIVDFAGVSEFIDTPVKRYSSGMNARLGFAVAAHLDPEVLLIDEVLSVGDLSFQEKCYERMQRFARSGAAVVFVSHNLSAISSLCTSVLVLRHGRVEILAPTQEAITVYAGLVQEARVAELGHHEVNVRLVDAAGRPVIDVESGRRIDAVVTAFPPAGASKFHSELQVRHLESGTMVFRCQSHSVGAQPVAAGADGGLDIRWSIETNFGRGHYAVTCVILNEHFRWVAVSAPSLLTVNERQSEQALVYLDASCSMQPLGTLSAHGADR